MPATPKASESARPLVSVGMPVYNAAPWVESAIRSILEQTHTGIELIVCDNASTDDSYAICQKLAAQDSRIRCHRHARNIGANRNYQSVLNRATGEYFKWASSSDLCAPTFLADCVAALAPRPDAVLAIGRTVLFEQTIADGRASNDDFALLSDDPKERYTQLFGAMRLTNVINGVMRTAALKALVPMGTFEAADNVMVAELALQGKFLLLDKPLYYRRMTPATATKLKSVQEAQQHMEPSAKQPLLWQSWQFHIGLLRAAMRYSPFGLTWFRIVGHALRQWFWARRDLMGDVLQALQRAI
jgi:hypothetical protein